MISRPRARARIIAVCAALLIPTVYARADDDDRGPRTDKPAEADEQVFEFSGLDIGGRLRTPQLLYFLDRAREELAQASLERRSFLPEMVRSIDEESL